MPRLDKQDWLRGALALANTHGFAAVKIEPLAKSLGITKGSFYHHFDDRPALLDALLAYWVDHDTDQVIKLISAGPTATPAEALHRLADLAMGVNTELDGMETAVREWAVHEPAVAATVADVDEQRLTYATELLIESGVAAATARNRAHVFYRVIIGEYLWRRYGGDPIDMTEVHALIDWAVEP